MEQSILKTTKKILGIDPDYDVFDIDIITHINATFSALQQIGVGPEDGFMIEDAEPTWESLLGKDPRLNNIKTYIYLKVRLLFDPPASSNLINAYNEQIKEMEWRISVTREEEQWQNPFPTTTT